MKTMHTIPRATLLVMLLASLTGWTVGWMRLDATPVQAALYWFHGVRSKEITVCFAGNAVDARPDRVREIVGHLQQFEFVANIRFLTLDGVRIKDAAAAGGDIHKLACPAPTWVNGKHSYNGDIRVALLNTDVPVDPPGMVPGVGCTQARVGSSWSNPPDELDLKRPCQYNLKLGDDDLDMTVDPPGTHTGTPWLNHTLHEFGHALGLSHEHARVDENASCVYTLHDEYHTANTGYITPYDKNSVMHYRFWPNETPQCVQTGSNYSNAGFTAYDGLALHLMYPEDVRVAEFIGKTVVRVGEPVALQSTLTQRGATSFAVNNFQWRVDGVLKSTSDSLNLTFAAPGDHTLQLSYNDFLDRNYSYSGTIHVLEAATFDAQMAAVQQAQLSMVMSGIPANSIYLPVVPR
ncbi:MAG TPA: hypothetical protein DEP84_15445 [Chloroflexi bacterium]|nr:hypothetical protein [Chloroflexota bacterium]